MLGHPAALSKHNNQSRFRRMGQAKLRTFCEAVARAPRLGVSQAARDGFSTKNSDEPIICICSELQPRHNSPICRLSLPWNCKPMQNRIHRKCATLKEHILWINFRIIRILHQRHFHFLCAPKEQRRWIPIEQSASHTVSVRTAGDVPIPTIRIVRLSVMNGLSSSAMRQDGGPSPSDDTSEDDCWACRG